MFIVEALEYPVGGCVIRLLIVLAIVGMTMYLTVFKQGPDQKPELIHQETLDQFKGLEAQMQQDAIDQQKKIDELTR